MRALMIGLVLLFALPSFADSTRCDCAAENQLGICRATVKKNGNQINITSSSNQCSWVMWTSDGDPRNTIVLDGEDVQAWLGTKTDPDLKITSCVVCKDRVFAQTPTTSQPPGFPAEPGQISAPEKPGASFEGLWTGYTDGPFGAKKQQQAEFQIRFSGTGRASGHYINLQGPVRGEITNGTFSGENLRLTTTYKDGASTEWTLTLMSDGTLKGKWKQQGMFRGNVVLQKQGS